MIFVTTGGSGGLSTSNAVIHVTAPASSTISFSKGGVIVEALGPEKSHISATDSTLANWYYSVSSNNYGTWTVNSSDGSSSTVEIDSPEVYDIALYEVNIYLYGNEYSNITGGWKVANHTHGTGKKNADNIQLTYTADNARVSKAYTNSMIDVEKYSKLWARVNVTASGANSALYLSTNNTNVADVPSYSVASQSFSGTGIKEISVNISSITGWYYVCVAANISNMYVYRVWFTF